MHRRSRGSRWAASLAVLALVLAACGGSAEPSPAATDGEPVGDEPVTLTFSTFETPEKVALLEGAIARYEETQANVTVELEPVALDEALPGYTRQANADGGPDVFHAFLTWPAQLARNGLAVELSALADQTGEVPGAGFDDYAGIDVVTEDGGIWGLPWTVDTFTLGYNPESLERAGVTEVPESWDELAAVAREVTGDFDGDQQFGFCFPAASTATSSFWHLFNAHLGGQTGKGLVFGELGSAETATPDQVADTLAYLNQFVTDGSMPTGLLSVEVAGGPEIKDQLASGGCAMAFIDPISFSAALQDNPDLRSTANPTGDAGIAPRMGGRSLMINPNSPNAEAAWDFIRFLNTEEAFNEHYTGFLPADGSVRTQVLEAQFGEATSGFDENLAEATTYVDYVSLLNNASLWAAATEAWGAVSSGQASPQDAAGSLVAEAEALLEAGP